MIQKGREIRHAVPIVMITHEAREANVQKALAEIHQLDIIAEKTILIRIEDPNLDCGPDLSFEHTGRLSRGKITSIQLRLI